MVWSIIAEPGLGELQNVQTYSTEKKKKYKPILYLSFYLNLLETKQITKT